MLSFKKGLLVATMLAAIALSIPASTINQALAVFTSTTNGLVPASGGGTTNFLRADGTFAVPPAGSGTVTSVTMAGTANQIAVTGTCTVTTTGTCTFSIPNSPTLPGTTTGTFSGNLAGTASGNTVTVGSGTITLATSAISSATCTAAQTVTITGAASTDTLEVTFAADPTATTGYIPSTLGMLTIIPYPTTNTANVKVCNNTLGSITPGAATLNVRVVR
jgi:hypothetical protein